MGTKLKLISWNVNGIRAAAGKGFGDWLKREQPAVLCLQETKISTGAREETEFDFADYDEYWHSADRPGYSGTAILAKVKPLAVVNGLDQPEFDQEGRVQTAEFEKFFLVNAYFPNSNHELSRLAYKEKFNDAFLKYVKKLEKKKPLVICGDFNVAREPIDLARPRDNEGNAGYTKEERAWAKQFIKAGFVDTFRQVNGDKVQYSWWTYRFYARDRNIGWRIDYFFVSETICEQVKEAFILDEITGSDHAPIGITLEI